MVTIKYRDFIDKSLLFLLGIFSTLQILEIFNVTMFTFLLIITTIYFLLTRRFDIKNNKTILIFLFLCFLTTILTYVNRDFDNRYRVTTLAGFINYFSLFLIYIGVKNKNETETFFKGFRISCYIQLSWAVIQFILSEFFGLDFNKIIFNDLLNLSGTYSTYRDGKAVCTGLHWHPANLIPSILFIFLFHKSIILKLLCLIVTYYSKSATMLIAVGFGVLYFLVKFGKKIVLNEYRFKKKDIVIGVIAICIILIGSSKIIDAVNMLISRISQINSTVAGTSSAVHFDYYTSLPDIYSKNTFISKFFGVGLSSSGIVFSTYYGQYQELIWVVESDIVNILLSQGILGFVLFYYILVSNIKKVIKIDIKVAIFASILLICGVTYNVQFFWLILTEMLLFKQCHYINLDIGEEVLS